jgi:soluble lytic murein transglycosylase
MQATWADAVVSKAPEVVLSVPVPFVAGRADEAAASALAAGDAEGALAHLDHAIASGHGPPEAGSPAALVTAALRGRAHRVAGRPAAAVAALESALADLQRQPGAFPADVLRWELNQARVAHAATLPAAESDAVLVAAAKDLAALAREDTLRNLAHVRVLHARALAGIRGSSPRSRVRAAAEAERALARVLADYPAAPTTGELSRLRADALARAGKTKEAFAAYLEVWLERAGEVDATLAWDAATRLAAQDRRLQLPREGTSTNLTRARHARALRRLELSRRLLDEILAEATAPSWVRTEALVERAATADRQRDYAQCAADLREAGERGLGNRDALQRCLERAHQYDEARRWYQELAKARRGPARAGAWWEELQLALRGGQYAAAAELLERYEKISRGHPGERRWLHAWIPFRTGQSDLAKAAFAEYERTASGEAWVRARYFRGLLMVRGQGEERVQGIEILTGIAEEDALGYWGLLARHRLRQSGVDLAEPRLTPLAAEANPPTWAESRQRLEDAARTWGAAFPSLPRAAALHAAGWAEESRREVRIAAESFLQGAGRARGQRTSGPRSEELFAGLGWRGHWSQPRLGLGKEARALLRDSGQAAQLRADLRAVAWAVGEAHHFAKLAPSSEPQKSRWHPRAFRPLVEAAAADHGFAPEHLWALMYTESRFRAQVISPVGARGAVQIMPWTGRQIAERLGESGPESVFDPDRLFTPTTNVKYAAWYFAALLEKFDGAAPLAYASYNGGPNSVARWLVAKSGTAEPLEVDAFVEEIPFDETQRYVRRVMEVHAAYALLYRGHLPRWDLRLGSVARDNVDF